MDMMLKRINDVKKFNFSPIWLGETGTDWCSCANKTTTFLDGFFWVDKLGLCASNGVDMVIREDMWGASFGLLNFDMTPRPDYWITFLHKKLVGAKVYNVSMEEENKNVRLYAGSKRR